MSDPSPNGGNGDGRDSNGRFAPGWKGGPGNPFARQVSELRSALLSAVTKEDLQAVVKSLIVKAKRGDVPAAREVLERCLGRPVEADLFERLELLEQQVSEESQGVRR